MDHDGHTRLEDVEKLLRQTLDAVNSLREEQADFRRDFQEFRGRAASTELPFRGHAPGTRSARRRTGGQDERNGRPFWRPLRRWCFLSLRCLAGG